MARTDRIGIERRPQQSRTAGGVYPAIPRRSLPTPMRLSTDRNQHIRWLNAQRRLARLLPTARMSRTHFFVGATAVAVPAITTATSFPDRAGAVTFSAEIEIVANIGVHEGLVFEFGSSLEGAAVWVENEGIGFCAGKPGGAGGASVLFDYGAELPPGSKWTIAASTTPGSGRVVLQVNSEPDVIAVASLPPISFWADAGDGSFASAPNGTVNTDVPIASRQAPDGFKAISGLSVYVNQGF